MKGRREKEKENRPYTRKSENTRAERIQRGYLYGLQPSRLSRSELCVRIHKMDLLCKPLWVGKCGREGKEMGVGGKESERMAHLEGGWS